MGQGVGWDEDVEPGGLGEQRGDTFWRGSPGQQPSSLAFT